MFQRWGCDCIHNSHKLFIVQHNVLPLFLSRKSYNQKAFRKINFISKAAMVSKNSIMFLCVKDSKEFLATIFMSS